MVPSITDAGLAAASSKQTHTEPAIESSERKEQLDVVSGLSEALTQYQQSRRLFSGKYRTLSEFKNFKPAGDSTIIFCGVKLNEVQTAEEIIRSREPHEHFEDTHYHIALRHGELHAQKDRVMSLIYKHFLGRAPDIDIIQNGEDFYVASRTIKQFEHPLSDYVPEIENLLKESATGKIFRLKGLGSIAAIDYFFGSLDCQTENWGAQKQGSDLVAYRIDSADALDVSALKIPITKEMIDLLPNQRTVEDPSSEKNAACYSMLLPGELAKSKIFMEEVYGMLKKIAASDFFTIREFIENINVSLIDEEFWMLNRMLPLIKKGPEALSQECEQSLEDCTNFIESSKKNLTLKALEELKKNRSSICFKSFGRKAKPVKSYF